MKEYPSIPHQKEGHFGKKCLAFDKLDGSNMRFEWSKKRFKKGESNNGFYKSGTRTQMIDRNHEIFGNAVDIFHKKYSESLAKIFTNHKNYKNTDSFIVFAEYVGKNSFAGQHTDNSEDMDVVLFDVNPHKKGIISGFEFVDIFGNLHIPEIVYEGNYNKEFVHDVQNGKYNVSEGVVAKGAGWQCKVKTKEWVTKVKEKMSGNLGLFSADINSIEL